MTDSVFSSPARSWKDVRNGSLPDSENEMDTLDQYLSMDTPAGPDLTIISGWMKFRDQKRWRLRWGVVTKLSPAAGISSQYVPLGPNAKPLQCLHYPLKPLPDPCTIKNIQVHDKEGELVVDDKTCGHAVNASYLDLDRTLVIAFSHYPYTLLQYESSFLLAVLDKSNGQLIELATNVSLDWKNFGTILRPPTTTEEVYLYSWGTFPTRHPRNPPRPWQQLKNYDRPVFNHAHHVHELHFLIFIQDKYRVIYEPVPFDPKLATPFDFHEWLNELVKAGNLLCGPVGGAKVLLYDETFLFPPADASTVFPDLDPTDEDTAHRASCNGSLLSVIMVTILLWQTRQ